MEKILEQILNELKELKTRQERLETGQKQLEAKIEDIRRSMIKDLPPSIESFDRLNDDRTVGIQSRFERFSRTRSAENTENTEKQDSEDQQTKEQTNQPDKEDIQKNDGLSGITADRKVTEYLANPKKKELRSLVNSVVAVAHDLFPGRKITLAIRGELLFLEIEGKDEKDIEKLQKLNAMSSSFEEFIIDLDFQ